MLGNISYSPYLVRMPGNTDHNNSEYEHFLSSDCTRNRTITTVMLTDNHLPLMIIDN